MPEPHERGKRVNSQPLTLFTMARAERAARAPIMAAVARCTNCPRISDLNKQQQILNL